MAKKRQPQNKFNPATALIGLIVVLGLAFSGMQFPEILDFLLGTETKIETKEAPKSQTGDNPGPIEHGA
ncbi:MAG: hypothetical protein ACRCVH_13615, partial [Vagococcus fluvialis]